VARPQHYKPIHPGSQTGAQGPSCAVTPTAAQSSSPKVANGKPCPCRVVRRALNWGSNDARRANTFDEAHSCQLPSRIAGDHCHDPEEAASCSARCVVRLV
jgi:hypothetical protein